MNNIVPDHIKTLGFGKYFVKAALAVATTGRVSFALSERRQTHGRELKFVAQLIIKPGTNAIKAVKYHAVDITPGFKDGSPEHNAALTEIEARLRTLYLNHPVFLDRKAYPHEVARFFQRESEKIIGELERQPYVSREDAFNKEKLYLKYLEDTVYSLAHPLSLGTLPYERHFDVLTISPQTGMIPVQRAADLLITHQVNNRMSVDERKLAVDDLKKKTTHSTKRRTRGGGNNRPGKGNKI